MNALSQKKYRVNDEPLEAYIGEPADITIPLMLPVFSEVLDINYSIAEQTMIALLNNKEIPSLEDYRRVAWIMAANINRLKDKPLAPFEKVEFNEWVPVSVVDHKHDINKRGDGNLYTFKCLGGTPCTEKFNKFFSYSQASWLSHILFGMTKFSKLPAYGVHLVGMRTWVLLEPSPKLDFFRGQCEGSFVPYNRKLLHARLSEPCPAGNPPPCHECPVGLDYCERAVHSTTYEQRQCSVCHNAAAWFNVTDSVFETKCLTCRDRLRLKYKRKER